MRKRFLLATMLAAVFGAVSLAHADSTSTITINGGGAASAVQDGVGTSSAGFMTKFGG